MIRHLSPCKEEVFLLMRWVVEEITLIYRFLSLFRFAFYRPEFLNYGFRSDLNLPLELTAQKEYKKREESTAIVVRNQCLSYVRRKQLSHGRMQRLAKSWPSERTAYSFCSHSRKTMPWRVEQEQSLLSLCLCSSHSCLIKASIYKSRTTDDRPGLKRTCFQTYWLKSKEISILQSIPLRIASRSSSSKTNPT